MRLVPLVLALLGCNHDGLAISDGSVDLGADLAGADLYRFCPTQELAFTQADGCANDGSVEFCIPAGDPALLARIATIAPSVHCAPGGGRAQCDSSTQPLCSLPTSGPPMCVTQHGALSDEGWRLVCELASLPEVTRIVHTILE